MVTTRAGAPPARTAVPPSGSTLDDVVGTDATRRGRLGRRVAVGAMTLLVLAGLSGVLGVRSATTTALEGGWTLTVTYLAVLEAEGKISFFTRDTASSGAAERPSVG